MIKSVKIHIFNIFLMLVLFSVLGYCIVNYINVINTLKYIDLTTAYHSSNKDFLAAFYIFLLIFIIVVYFVVFISQSFLDFNRIQSLLLFVLWLSILALLITRLTINFKTINIISSNNNYNNNNKTMLLYKDNIFNNEIYKKFDILNLIVGLILYSTISTVILFVFKVCY